MLLETTRRKKKLTCKSGVKELIKIIRIRRHRRKRELIKVYAEKRQKEKKIVNQSVIKGVNQGICGTNARLKRRRKEFIKIARARIYK